MALSLNLIDKLADFTTRRARLELHPTKQHLRFPLHQQIISQPFVFAYLPDRYTLSTTAASDSPAHTAGISNIATVHGAPLNIGRRNSRRCEAT
jgi:hypothetical protein